MRRVVVADKMNEFELIGILTIICRLLSGDPLTVDDVRPEVADLPLAVTIEPKPGTDTPAFVRLVLPESSRLSLDALQKAFGPYSELPRLHLKAGAEFIFYVDWAETPYTCAIVAETSLEQAAILAVTVRRDIRLE
jgi:hypothetical protein